MLALFQKKPDPWTVLSEKLEAAKTMVPGRDLDRVLSEILEARHPKTGKLLLGIAGYGTPIINTCRQLGLVEDLLDQFCIRLESDSFDNAIVTQLSYLINYYFRQCLSGERQRSLLKESSWACLLASKSCFPSNPYLNAAAAHSACLIHPEKSLAYLRTMRALIAQQRPTGWRESPPMLLILPGPGKCGTTSLYEYLVANYRILSYPCKEMDYWDVYLQHGLSLDWYLSHFADIQAGPAGLSRTWIECSPSTFGCSQVVAKAFEHHWLRDRVRVLLTIRDPIDRVKSMISHDIRCGIFQQDEAESRVQDMLREALAGKIITYPNYLQESRYELFAEPWFSCFGKERVSVLPLEQAGSGAVDRIMAGYGIRKSGRSSTYPFSNAESSRRRSIWSDAMTSALVDFFSPTYAWMQSVM
ncbi:MAG: hypothetical protein VKO19_04915 [Cyanobacteriota bacterium]|nr:hypothetical protein [Cyanobacteriota bacterium]